MLNCSSICLFTNAIEYRYKILAATQIKDGMTNEKAAQIILDAIQLDPEQYRMGKTKVYNDNMTVIRCRKL